MGRKCAALFYDVWRAPAAPRPLAFDASYAHDGSHVARREAAAAAAAASAAASASAASGVEHS